MHYNRHKLTALAILASLSHLPVKAGDLPSLPQLEQKAPQPKNTNNTAKSQVVDNNEDFDKLIFEELEDIDSFIGQFDDDQAEEYGPEAPRKSIKKESAAKPEMLVPKKEQQLEMQSKPEIELPNMVNNSQDEQVPEMPPQKEPEPELEPELEVKLDMPNAQPIMDTPQQPEAIENKEQASEEVSQVQEEAQVNNEQKPEILVPIYDSDEEVAKQESMKGESQAAGSVQGAEGEVSQDILLQSTFAEDELKVLLNLEDDDILLGKLSNRARLEQMSNYNYIKLFRESYGKLLRQRERNKITHFIENYEKNFDN